MTGVSPFISRTDSRPWAPFATLVACALLAGCALSPGRVGYLVNAPQRRPLVVETLSGPVRGVATARGQAFLGIPFAAPPVGSLRFRAPTSPASWRDVRDATRAGAICPQKTFPGSGRQSEDCLTLNVYGPAGSDPARPRPVMVWLYGGGFTTGDNVEYDPSRLAERQDVLVVAPNYRLGPFGFLAHPALRGEGEGAYALLDQQAALRWVAANIARFGGDPRNVTLFGESAGAWSVCYQLAAPGAQGLFQHAILESGACLSPLSVTSLAQAEAGGVQMAASVGCGVEAEAADCLRRLSAHALLNAKASRRGLLGLNSWSPPWGGDVLPLDPRTAFEAGRFPAVPVIDGTNHDEGRLFLYTDRLQGRLLTQGSYEKILHDSFEEATPRVLAEYAPEAKRSLGLAYADVVTDSTFACPALTLNALVERRAPVYAYEFEDPHAATSLPPTPFTPPLRAYHTSELAYIFQTPWAIADPASFDRAQRALSDRIQAYWGAFARSGDPNGAGRPYWPPRRGRDGGLEPIRLSPTMSGTMSDFASAHHCAFWSTLGY